MKHVILGAVCIALFAPAAAAADIGWDTPIDCAQLTQNDNPATLPYLGFTTHAKFASSSGTTAALSNMDGGQGYTRLRLRFIPCRYVPPATAAEAQRRARAYELERRDWTRRLFAPKTVTKVLTVKTTVASPSVSTVYAVATVGRDSSRRVGETWSTEISNSRWLTPYFRVNGDTIATVDINLAANTDYKLSMSADVLDLVKRAAGLLSPTTTLVTTLNKDRFNDAASFIDTSISNFLKMSVAERAVNDFQVGTGNENLGAIFLNLPGANDTLASTSPVGVWVISTDRIIPSIFKADETSMSLSSGEISASSIMNFLVAPDQSLRQALASKTGVSAAHDALLQADDGAVDAKAKALCQAIRSESEAMGFAPIDVRAIGWAYAEVLLQGSKKGKLQESCKLERS